MKFYDDLNLEASNFLNSINNNQEELIRLTSASSTYSLDLICSIKLLICEVKFITGYLQEGLQNLCFLSQRLEAMIISLYKNKPSQEKSTVSINNLYYWHWHVVLQQVNAYIRLRNWKQAITILKNLNKDIETRIQDNIASNLLQENEFLYKGQFNLLIRLFKIYLQIGAIKLAHASFESASTILRNFPNFNSDYSLVNQLLLCQGLLYFSENDYVNALSTFDNVINIEKNTTSSTNCPLNLINSLEFYGNKTIEESIFNILKISNNDNILSSAINNFAITSLYLKRNSEGINLLESLILENPYLFLIDPIVFNLCTMYDLSYASDISDSKKKALQKLALKYNINDPILNYKSFRLMTN